MTTLRLLRRVLVLPALVLLAASAWVAASGLSDRVASADAAVVPGSRVNPDGSLSPRLKARLDAALRIYRAGRCKLIVVSGGTGSEGHDEAAAMKAYLVAQAVPPAAVLQDSLGANTAATAHNAAALLRLRGYRTVIATSQYFHLPRLRRLLADQGLDVVGSEHARYFEARDAYSLPREVVALGVLMAR